MAASAPSLGLTARRIAGIPTPERRGERDLFLLNLLNSTAHQDLSVQPALRNIGRQGMKPPPAGFTRRHIWGFDSLLQDA